MTLRGGLRRVRCSRVSRTRRLSTQAAGRPVRTPPRAVVRPCVRERGTPKGRAGGRTQYLGLTQDTPLSPHLLRKKPLRQALAALAYADSSIGGARPRPAFAWERTRRHDTEHRGATSWEGVLERYPASCDTPTTHEPSSFLISESPLVPPWNAAPRGPPPAAYAAVFPAATDSTRRLTHPLDIRPETQHDQTPAPPRRPPLLDRVGFFDAPKIEHSENPGIR